MTDFIVTIHALERLGERFPDLVAGMSDDEQGALVHKEVIDAMEAGRVSMIAPLELASYDTEHWRPSRGKGPIVWIEDKSRGYVLREDDDEGLLVLTVLVGKERETMQSVLKRSPKRPMRNAK